MSLGDMLDVDFEDMIDYLGAALLQRCISIAKERGIEKVMGAVLAENTQMLALWKK